ncbi:hypothetical protein [Ralstonia soli]|uniref:Transmembrane protein n=1 Tax=Ralstonia soli TaxID=2953896 RepID=A0ABT1ALW6_9RALS|nr:hypothetical protein [Ralstonia soli]MCO5399427.1 hypothetical protein [Ralstonia soli]
MKHMTMRFLLAVAMLTAVSGTVVAYAALYSPMAHAEPCGGRGYPEGKGGCQP